MLVHQRVSLTTIIDYHYWTLSLLDPIGLLALIISTSIDNDDYQRVSDKWWSLLNLEDHQSNETRGISPPKKNGLLSWVDV